MIGRYLNNIELTSNISFHYPAKTPSQKINRAKNREEILSLHWYSTVLYTHYSLVFNDDLPDAMPFPISDSRLV